MLQVLLGNDESPGTKIVLVKEVIDWEKTCKFRLKTLTTSLSLRYKDWIFPGQKEAPPLLNLYHSSSWARSTRTRGRVNKALMRRRCAFATSLFSCAHPRTCPGWCAAMSDSPVKRFLWWALSPARYIQAPSEDVRARRLMWPERWPGASMI